MSHRETSAEIASMAGRILASGNPLDNEQVILALVEAIAAANSGAEVQTALKTLFGPYLENALSLAGSCLSQAEPDDGENGPQIVMTATVEWEKIVNAIIGAYEGGSTYWLREASYVYTPKGVEGNPMYAEAQFWAKGGKMKLHYDDPEIDERCATKDVGLIEIKAGLRSMAEKDPKPFADLLSENDDAITHDVFIQHVLFGEVIYG